ncbi:MAG: complex I subunit 5 family protein [Clostridia bacterium]|nr:complex I subunit 5 family protein [Clostridia bacterium]
MDLITLTFFPMIMAFVCLIVGYKNEKVRNIIAVITGLLELGLAIYLFFSDYHDVSIPLLAGLHLEFDGFRKIYVIIISLMWAMTLLLSPEYFAHHHNLNRYYFFNLLTLGATVGVFLAADLYTAFVFFEIMSFTSFTWVIQEETKDAIKAAITYLSVAVIGGLVALMGLFLIQHNLGTTEISKLYELAEECDNKLVLYIAAGCVLFGFGAKAGMFPLHIWLPKAHPVAPAPASALLSGVLTKSGIWGILAISCQIFREDKTWGTIILTLGTITMVLGAVLALFSINLKRTLACSSLSQIGFILVGIGMMCLLGEENALAARGTLLHMVNHSLFKLVLFECAGIVFFNLHELDLNKIRGFGRKKPLLNIAFLLGGIGIGGIPLLNGYVSKTLLHEGIVEGSEIFGMPLKIVEWLFLLSGGMTLAYMTKLYVCIFVEKNATRQLEFDSKKKYMSLPSAIAVLLPAAILPILGLFANKIMNGIADIGTDFFSSGELEHQVHYLSLENLKGALISIVIGAILYLLFIRKVLMKNNEYINIWPEKLDIEELIYRPLLLKVLPNFFGYISAIFGENKVSGYVSKKILSISESIGELFGENKVTSYASKKLLRFFGILGRFICDIPDALVFALKKTVYRPITKHNDDKVTSALSYRLGNDVDKIAIHEGKEKAGSKHYAHLFYTSLKTFTETTNRIMGNLSFALLMLVIAICIVFAYMLLHN